MKNGTIIDKQKFPSPHRFVDVYLITYLSEGLKVKGFLAVPKWGDRLPGFLYLRGGIRGVGMVRIGRIIQFASKGFVVMAPFYRGNFGGEGLEDFGGRDRNDAIHAISVLEQIPKVKADEIHVFGFSRGGIMALFTGIYVKHVASIVTWGGVSDMTLTYEERIDLRRMLKRVIGATPWKAPDCYAFRTPLHLVDQINAPVLIIHGEKDQNVSVKHALMLKQKLQQYDKHVTTWILKDNNHYFPPKLNREIVDKLTAWMKMQDKVNGPKRQQRNKCP